jgi:hypothetical protein
VGESAGATCYAKKSVAGDMGAWETERMFRRYTHSVPAYHPERAERIAGLVGGTELAYATKEKGPGKRRIKSQRACPLWVEAV